MTTKTHPGPGLASVASALGDETRWQILRELGREELSASALSDRLPVSRQAIAKHLGVLADVGLVDSVRVGRELRYRAVGEALSAFARSLESIGSEWDRRLGRLRHVAESLGSEARP